MQLSDKHADFTALGINLVTVTYDSNADAANFHAQRQLKLPILHDADSSLIKRLGILNTGPEPGDRFYGIPYPGIFLIDQEGIIRGKWAEENFRDRPDLEPILRAAEAL